MIRAHVEAHIHHSTLAVLARRYAQHPDHHHLKNPFRSSRAYDRMARQTLLTYTPIHRARGHFLFRAIRLPGDPFIMRRPSEREKG